MKSALNRLKHNERRAGELRFIVLEAIREHLTRNHLGEHQGQAPEDGLLLLVAVDAGDSSRVRIHEECWFPTDWKGDIHPASLLYAQMLGNLRQGTYQPDLGEDEMMHVASVRIAGLNTLDAQVTEKQENPEEGMMVGFAFVDGSEAVFVIDREGYTKMTGSTHPIAGIPAHKIDKSTVEIADVHRALRSSSDISSHMEDQAFVDAMVNGLAVASDREMELYPTKS